VQYTEYRAVRAGKLTLTEFKRASFVFSGKYFCLGGHAGKKWEISGTAEEFTLMETPKRMKLKDLMLSVYKWKDPEEPKNDGFHINMAGYLKLGGESETVLGGGSFYTSVAYQVGGAAANKTLYERQAQSTLVPAFRAHNTCYGYEPMSVCKRCLCKANKGNECMALTSGCNST